MLDNNKHNQMQHRENPDPIEQHKQIPSVVLIIVGFLFLWAAGYILFTQRNDDPTLGDRRTVDDINHQNTSNKSIDGAQIYASQCISCHQAGGNGISGVFPPLAGSDWVLGKEAVPINILLHGINGKLTVNGVVYEGSMPSFKDKLSDDEIAALLSYIRSNFGNNSTKILSDKVKAVRAETIDRQQPWGGDNELAPLK